MLYEAATQNGSEFVKAMLRSVNPDDRLWIIQKQIGRVSSLIDISHYHCETFRLILESVSREERLRLVCMDDIRMTLFHLAMEHTETFRMLLQSVSSDERLQSLQFYDYYRENKLFHIAAESADTLGMILQSVSSDEAIPN